MPFLSFGLLKNYQCHLNNVVHANVAPDGGEKLCHFPSVGLCLTIGLEHIAVIKVIVIKTFTVSQKDMSVASLTQAQKSIV